MKHVKWFVFWIYLLGNSIVFAQETQQQAQQPPAKIAVQKVQEGEIAKTIQIVGIVDFNKRSGISSEISGLIQTHHMIEGSTVSKGDVLVRLNTDFIEKSIQIMKLQLEQTNIKIENTQKNLKRYEVLYKEQATSEKAYDDLSDSYRELVKARDIILKNIEKLNLELNKSVIRAPFDGIILERNKNEGEWVSPGSPICTLASINDVFVTVAVPEDLVQYIHIGDPISYKINALGKDVTGNVVTFVPVADIKTKTFQVRISVSYMKELIQNMTVTVTIPASHRMKLKLIKRDALINFQGKDFVYTVKDNVAKIVPINIVAYEGQYIGVDDPHILPGMIVVTDGNDRLRPDQPVQIVEK